MAEPISVLREEVLDDSPEFRLTLLRLSNGLTVKCESHPNLSNEERREVLVVDDKDIVIEHGPEIWRTRRYGSTTPVVEISWSSGRARTLAEMDAQLEQFAVARWMAEELEVIQ